MVRAGLKLPRGGGGLGHPMQSGLNVSEVVSPGYLGYLPIQAAGLNSGT